MPAPSSAWSTAAQSNNWSYQVTATLWNSPSPGPQQQVVSQPLIISDGSVTVDRSNATRRSGSLVVADPLGTAFQGAQRWLPYSLSDPLAPNGNELHISATARIPTTGGGFITSDAISLGRFAITDVVIDDTGADLTLTVQFFDRSWVVAERVFGPGGLKIPPGYNLTDIVAQVIETVYPGMPRNVSGLNPAPAPKSTFAEGDNPWQDLTNTLSQGSLGYELFFDTNGTLTGFPVPDPTQATPAWSFVDNKTSTSMETQRTFTRSGIANDMIRSSAGTSKDVLGGPFRAEADDSNVNSPTWVSGPFGRIYNFATSSFITSELAAEQVAKNDLQTALGQTDVITLTTLPLPFLDIDDVITVTRSRLGMTNAKYVIDSITIPFRFDGTSQIVARRVIQ